MNRVAAVRQTGRAVRPVNNSMLDVYVGGLL